MCLFNSTHCVPNLFTWSPIHFRQVKKGFEPGTPATPSLKELSLDGVFPLHSVFILCCISHSFIFWLRTTSSQKFWEDVVLMWKMHLRCLSFLSSMLNTWMIGSGIGVRGAKRMGEMLEKNTSLMTIDPSGWVFTEHIVLFCCHLTFFGWRCSPEESEYWLREGYWWCSCCCVVYCRESCDWRWRSHSNCRRIGEECFIEDLEPQRCVLTTGCLHPPSFLVYRLKSHICVINFEWMNDRLSNSWWRCKENGGNVGDKWNSDGIAPSRWVSNGPPHCCYFSSMLIKCSFVVDNRSLTEKWSRMPF